MNSESPLEQLLAELTETAAPELVVHEGPGMIRCLACGNRCVIGAGQSGICRMRANRDGELRAPHGYVAGLQVDPIEKKPFFHAFPGRDALSFGMLGCNLHCSFCQNWVSSQTLKDNRAGAHPRPVSAASLAEIAEQEGAPVIVSTYNEPLITAEWAVSVFEAAKERGIRCGFVSNGNASPEVIDFLRPHMDLYKVDLKSFRAENYRELGCDINNVLRTIEKLKEDGFWVEVVTLVVPGFNDSGQELRDIAGFIAGVSLDIPWHVTAFHPDYKMADPSRTTPEHLARAHAAGREAGLRYVYAGNPPGRMRSEENTWCHHCGALLIERRGFTVRKNAMQGGACPECGTPIPGVWEDAAPTGGVWGRGPRPL